MTTTTKCAVNPYLSFDGRCEEAIEFYKKAIGAQVLMLMRFKDAPPGTCPEGMPSQNAERVMHARLQIGDSTVLMSDGRCAGKPHFEGISLSLTAPDPAEAERLFKALSDGGRVEMPLGKTFFSPAFGMLVDRFGVMWMVYVGE